MTTLLDGNVLVALVVTDHVHHQSAEQWWVGRADTKFATSPITQGTLLRLMMRSGCDAALAYQSLSGLTTRGDHEFWADDQPYVASTLRGVLGHRQVTDAYLADLARSRHGSVATFDAGFAATHPDVAELIATSQHPARA